MPPHNLPSVSVCRSEHRRRGRDSLRTEVWVRGEHDIATRVHLTTTIVQAAHHDDAGVVVDLSGVRFMDASTVGALVLASKRLRAWGRSLSVRAPSPQARRVLDLCDLEGLIDESPAPLRPPTAPALGSWVEVPTDPRDSDSAQTPSSDESVRVATRPGAEPAVAVDQSRS